MGLILIGLNLLPCYVGNEIEVNSSKLMTKLYESDWTDNDLKHKKNIVTMQSIMLSHPIKLKIAGIFAINLQTFLTLTNSTYTIIAFLSHLKH